MHTAPELNCWKIWQRLHRLSIDNVVFDGYNPSTKDGARYSIYRSVPWVVDISKNTFYSDSSEFLNSISNKTSLISFLGNIMKYEGIKILKKKFCANYIESPTVKEAIYNCGESVEAVSCDTAMLCLLLHHLTLLDIGKNIFMSSMKLN